MAQFTNLPRDCSPPKVTGRVKSEEATVAQEVDVRCLSVTVVVSPSKAHQSPSLVVTGSYGYDCMAVC